jgi:hypothetical protein
MRGFKKTVGFVVTYHQDEGLHVDDVPFGSPKLPILDEVYEIIGLVSADAVEGVPVGGVGVGKSVELQDLSPLLLQARVIAKGEGWGVTQRFKNAPEVARGRTKLTILLVSSEQHFKSFEIGSSVKVGSFGNQHLLDCLGLVHDDALRRAEAERKDVAVDSLES